MRAFSILLNWMLWPCAVVLGMALAVACASMYVSPATMWIPAFLGLYFVPLVVVNLLLLLIGLIKRSPVAWVPFICLLPALLFADLFVRWGKTEEAGGSGVSLKIATYNVCNFQGYEKKTREEAITEISRFLEREQMDIVCMQEFFCSDTGAVCTLFPSLPYPCFSRKSQGKSYRGNIIFSRYPIEEVGEITFPDTFRTCIYADISLHGRTIRVYTTHLESNKISLNALVDRIRKNPERSEELFQAHVRIREAFRIRARQVEIIAGHLRTVDMPFVFCGDLNDTPISYTYHQLQKGLNDSFRDAGKGFGATFRYFWPALRIDYIFCNHALDVRAHQTVRVPFSDHYPVITEFMVL